MKKTGRFIQFALAATQFAMAQSGLVMEREDAERVGVYVGSGIGAFEVIEREHEKLRTGGPGRVSPFFITATIANLAAGQISIRYGAMGPNLAHATGLYDGRSCDWRVVSGDRARGCGCDDRGRERGGGDSAVDRGVCGDAGALDQE